MLGVANDSGTGVVTHLRGTVSVCKDVTIAETSISEFHPILLASKAARRSLMYVCNYTIGKHKLNS
jgi:hypothetical protein